MFGVSSSSTTSSCFLTSLRIFSNSFSISAKRDIPAAHLLKEAGFIEDESDELPELSQYLRKKYQLSPQAIRDMETAKEIVDKKYSK